MPPLNYFTYFIRVNMVKYFHKKLRGVSHESTNEKEL